MSTAKEEVRRLLNELPDDVSFEEIQNRIHLYVRAKIGTAREAAGEAAVASPDEAERRMARWIDE